MPPETASNSRSGTTTANDAQPNYDQDVDDFLRDLPVGGDTTNNNNDANAEAPKDVDEEVKVRKKRAPVPKLDETLLLSHAGIPKLRQTGKKFRFKGKGHEFSDIERLLNMYQLWMDDMYPRAKFRDAVTMVEKVGHSKRMQITRRGWMDATKPHRREDSPERLEDVAMGDGANGGLRPAGGHRSAEGTGDDIFGGRANDEQRGSKQSERRNGDGVSEDDDLDALMAENDDENQNTASQHQQRKSKPTGPFEEDDDDGPDEDELDALLAGENSAPPKSTPHQSQRRRGPFEEDEEDGPDEDELDALMAEEGSKSDRNTQHQQPPPPETRRSNDDEFADEEEAMASMGGMW
ncbi:hypothetical protein KC332_g5898 [Hortaea werneckii]|uniref:Chromosome segregation in meiosis protein n=2 Tax=Hortaea werneckii TaxID=91943 RepID=A0A3M7I062_HORWE|nr:hypothetical protein KC350_g17122 [Hortaea werneckii]OTA38439.1 hypothetical protein BTJ68_01733 [Hortaea werneckii EXF-2000]KAI6835549.1 hypothetical protein KC358_g5564 [Hortaea werneckii]KAI6921076.1 hypothetical protein KC341_g16170 [Hortaea werneckii]KAI6936482.1 hypothetical protein KC348_g6010 [Hortaea werneckii]